MQYLVKAKNLYFRSDNSFRKAKKYVVGTVRKWKDGMYIKENDHHWKLLREIASKVAEEAGLEAGDDETKLLHTMSKAALEHIKDHPNPTLAALDRHMDQHDDEEYEDFDGIKNAVKHVVSKYVEEHSKLKNTEAPKKETPRKEAEKIEVPKKEAKPKGSIHFSDKLTYQRVKDMIARRGLSTSHAMIVVKLSQLDIESAKALVGHCINVDGVVGVVELSWYNRHFEGFSAGGRRSFSKGGIVAWKLLTPYGSKRVSFNPEKTEIVADPTGPSDEEIRATGPLKEAGIHSIVFDEDIPGHMQRSWQSEIETAFKELNHALGLNFHDKVKIQVYGSKGPRRGASADYNPRDKAVRLSVVKKGSGEALAHELGHALDDKMNGWERNFKYQTHNHWINEVVNAYRKTQQGLKELSVLEDTKRYRVTGEKWIKWATKSEEIFARCFETYIAHKIPKWQETGWAKIAIQADSFHDISKIFDQMFKDPKVLKAFNEVFGMSYLVKAKKYIVGTIRKWKDGHYIKDSEHHWKLLQDIVNETAKGVGLEKDHHETKLLHAMSSGALKHIKKQDTPSLNALHEHLDSYDHGTYENFDGFKDAVHHVLSKYVSEHKKLKTGKGEPDTKVGKRQSIVFDPNKSVFHIDRNTHPERVKNFIDKGFKLKSDKAMYVAKDPKEALAYVLNMSTNFPDFFPGRQKNDKQKKQEHYGKGIHPFTIYHFKSEGINDIEGNENNRAIYKDGHIKPNEIVSAMTIYGKFPNIHPSPFVSKELTPVYDLIEKFKEGKINEIANIDKIHIKTEKGDFDVHIKIEKGLDDAEKKAVAITPTGKKQQSWKEQLAEQSHLSQDKKDIWVAAQFMKKKKPILHLLKIAREVVGDRKDIEPSKGFAGLCKVILDRAYERGPDAFEMDSIERFTKAFHTYLEKVTATKQSPSTTDDDKIEGLLERNPFYKEHEEWFRYCVHRMMEKNGAVSYSGLKPYMMNAMKKYNGVVPDYEGKKKKVAKKKYIIKKERA